MASYGVEKTLSFGKHKGKRLGNVIVDDPIWVRWASTTIEWFNLDSNAANQLALSEEYRFQIRADNNEDNDPYEDDDYRD